MSSFALRDIKKGEEFCEDYGKYDYPEWLLKLCDEFGCEEDYYVIKEDKLPEVENDAAAGFHVKYKVEKASFGMGLIADQDIKKGTLVWKCKPGVNVRRFKGEKEARKHLATLPSFKARKDWLIHAYIDKGYLTEIIDDADFMNHSATPNLSSDKRYGQDPLSSYAARDIKKGEELFEDYQTF